MPRSSTCMADKRAGDGAVAGQPQRERAGQVGLGIIELLLRDLAPRAILAICCLMMSIDCLTWSLRVATPAHHQRRIVGLIEIGIDRISKAAFLAHLFHQPRAEATAAQDVVGDIGGKIVWIVAWHTPGAEGHHALRYVPAAPQRSRRAPVRSARSRVAWRWPAGPPNVLSSSGPSVAASMSPATPTIRLSLASRSATKA